MGKTEAEMKNEASVSADEPKTEDIVKVKGVEKGEKDTYDVSPKETSNLIGKPKIEEKLVPKKSDTTAQNLVKGKEDTQLEVTDAIKTDKQEKEIKKQVAESFNE